MFKNVTPCLMARNKDDNSLRIMSIQKLVFPVYSAAIIQP